MKRCLFLIAILVMLCSCANHDVEVNGSAYDVLSVSTYNKLQQKYISIEDFECGTAKVKAKGGWGLINSKGKEVLSSEYDTIYPLLNKFRIVQKNSLYGLVNVDGKHTIPCKYENHMRYLDNGIFAFQFNGKWGFVSSKDDIKVQFKYESIHHIEDSVFVGKINGYQGLFDFNDNTIINPEYDRIIYKPFRSDGGVSYAQKGDLYAIINSRNELVSKCEYGDWAVPYGDYVTIKSFLHDRFCLVNWETGEIKIPYGYKELGDYVEGLIYACKNNRYGYVNPDNEVVIPFKFADAENFSEGLAMVGVEKGHYLTFWGGYMPKVYYGFINSNGDWVINPTFPDQSLAPGRGFKEGLAIMGVERDDNIYPDKYGYIDKTGKWVIEPVYIDADDFVNGVAVVKTWRGYGAINKLGEIVVAPKYDGYDYRAWHNDKIVFKDKDGKKYEYSLEGIAL